MGQGGHSGEQRWHHVHEQGKFLVERNEDWWLTTGRAQSTNDVTEDEFDRVFAVNVKGVYLGCNAFTSQVIKQGTPGAIVNIASVGAHRPRPGLVWYNASKGAVANVSNTRRKWEPG